MLKLPFQIEEIIEKIESFGYEAYLVGGAVRDGLLGLKASDYDIASNASPDIIEEIFQDYRTIDIGKKYGTIMVVYKSYDVEITTYRRDGVYEDGRRPDKVFFSNELYEDLKRRDFTINAMAYNPSKGLKDFFNGQEDLKNRLIRTVGSPEKRFNEDYLRILRAVRFASQLSFKIEDSSYEACRKLAPKLERISQERIRDELFKILLSRKPSYGIELMKDLDILIIILPELDRTIGFEQNNPNHDKDVYYHSLEVIDRTSPDLITRLAALFHDLGKPESYSEDEKGIGHFYGHDKLGEEIVIRVLSRLNSPRKMIDSVSKIVSRHMADFSSFKDKGIKRLLANLGEEDTKRLLDLKRADRLGARWKKSDFSDIDEMEKKIKRILEAEEIYDKKELAINGNDVIELGYKEGKMIGEILSFAMDIVLEDSSLNDKEYLLKAISKRYGGKK